MLPCFMLRQDFRVIYEHTPVSLQVLFKLVLGSAKLGEATLYLTVLGGANMLFVSIVPLILLLTGAEDIGSPGDIPWPSLCGMAGLLLGKEFLNLQPQLLSGIPAILTIIIQLLYYPCICLSTALHYLYIIIFFHFSPSVQLSVKLWGADYSSYFDFFGCGSECTYKCR